MYRLESAVRLKAEKCIQCTMCRRFRLDTWWWRAGTAVMLLHYIVQVSTIGLRYVLCVSVCCLFFLHAWMMCVWCVCVQAVRQAHGGGRNETHCDGNLTSSFFACWRWCSARRGTRRLLHVQTGGYTKTISTQQQYLARVRCLLLAWFRNRPRLYVYTVHQGWQLREDFIGDLWVENC